ALRGRGRRRSSERVLEGRALLRRDGRNKRRRKRHTEGAIETAAGAGRQIAEEFAAVIVQTKSGSHGQFRTHRPGDTDTWSKSPLALSHQGIACAWSAK